MSKALPTSAPRPPSATPPQICSCQLLAHLDSAAWSLSAPELLRCLADAPGPKARRLLNWLLGGTATEHPAPGVQKSVLALLSCCWLCESVVAPRRATSPALACDGLAAARAAAGWFTRLATSEVSEASAPTALAPFIVEANARRNVFSQMCSYTELHVQASLNGRVRGNCLTVPQKAFSGYK